MLTIFSVVSRISIDSDTSHWFIGVQGVSFFVLSFKKSEEWVEPEQNVLRMMAMGTGHT